MKVKFKYTVDDFIDSGRKLKQYSNYNIKVLITSITLTALGTGILVYFTTSNWVGSAIGMVVAIGVVFLINPDPLAHTLRKFYENTYKTNEPIDTEIEILREGLVYIQLDIKTIFDWKTIKKIEVDEKAIYFYLVPECVLSVSTSAFESHEEKKSFIKTVNDYREKAGE